MRYVGGKHRIAKQLAGSILPHVRGRRLIEPFCGGLSATVSLQPDVASDASETLIKLIMAVRCGWEPPTHVSEFDYNAAKGTGTEMEAFCGHCMSFGGKWWGGYARESGRNFALQGRNALLRKVEATRAVAFSCQSYDAYRPAPGDVFYCDPPYRGVTNGYATGPFDSDAFWDWVRVGAQRGALMFVSEFQGPDWATVHAEFSSRTDLRKRDAGQQKTIEKLYAVGDLT